MAEHSIYCVLKTRQLEKVRRGCVQLKIVKNKKDYYINKLLIVRNTKIKSLLRRQK